MATVTLIGHHLLPLRLLEAGLLAAGAHIVIAGSEAARGDVPMSKQNLRSPHRVHKFSTSGGDPLIIESRKESMMMRRRSPFGVLLMVGFGVLIGAAVFGGTEAVTDLMAAPFVVLGFFFKVLLFFMLFGLFLRLVAGRGARGREWSGPSREGWAAESRRHLPCRGRPSDEETDRQPADRFDEWHRMAHARQEVDDHTPPVEA